MVETGVHGDHSPNFCSPVSYAGRRETAGDFFRRPRGARVQFIQPGPDLLDQFVIRSQFLAQYVIALCEQRTAPGWVLVLQMQCTSEARLSDCFADSPCLAVRVPDRRSSLEQRLGFGGFARCAAFDEQLARST